MLVEPKLGAFKFLDHVLPPHDELFFMKGLAGRGFMTLQSIRIEKDGVEKHLKIERNNLR